MKLFLSASIAAMLVCGAAIAQVSRAQQSCENIYVTCNNKAPSDWGTKEHCKKQYDLCTSDGPDGGRWKTPGGRVIGPLSKH